MRSARWANKKTYGVGKSTPLRIIVGWKPPDIGQLRIEATAPGAAGTCPGPDRTWLRRRDVPARTAPDDATESACVVRFLEIPL